MNDEDRDYGVLVLGVLAAILLVVIGWSTGVIPGNPAFAPSTASVATTAAAETAAPDTAAAETAAAETAAPDTTNEGGGALDAPASTATVDIVAATKAALAAQGVTATTGEIGVAIGAVPDQIRLTGEVANDGVKIQASDVAATVPGVASVDNQLTIAGAPETTPAAAVDTAASSAAAETTAAAPASAGPATITGTASEDGTVVLSGVVASDDVKTALGTALSSALPVGASIDNQVTVDPTASFDGLTLQLVGKARPDVAEALGKLAMPGIAGSTIDNQIAVVEAPKLEAEMNALFAAEPIQFDSGAATIKAASNTTLDRAAALMKATPTGSVALEGHTDDKGDPAKNQALSQARAEAVKAALIRRGIAAERLSAKGFGSSRPIADNATPEGRAKNRRVEVVVTG